jgi:predicted nucleic acid-binding protein
MSAERLWDGELFIADKSVWDRASLPQVWPLWEQALRADQIATCAIGRLELLYSARGAEEFASWEADLAALRDIPITRSELAAAVCAMRDLVELGERRHRVPLPDVILAATAAGAGVGVLHYDRHFDRLAEVLSFRSQWVLPRGTLLDERTTARRSLKARFAAAFRELRRP